MLKKPLISLCLIISSLILNGQNTLPSCVITAPHNNAYFMEGTDITILVYSSDLGGTYTGGSVTKVEFFVDDTILGETSTETSHTYSYIWTDVPAGTYRITAKATDNEDSVFTSAGVLVTIGSSEVQSIGISGGKGKYLANIIKGNVRGDFNTYWNGVTAENSCKWGSVEGTRDVMNWTGADIAYKHAKDFHMSFRYHALVWGSQYPSWITTLTPTEFQEEMEEYIAAAAARYPLIDQIDVLNENMYLNTWNGEEHAPGTPYFREGLGGPGVTGYDWAIWLFEKTRSYFPNAKLVINDFELVTNSNGLDEILDLVKVLRDRGLIDGIGTQSHYFNVDGISTSKLQNALNAMAASGVPIYVTEYDLKGSSQTEASQLSSYKTSFPVYWSHPAVAGITLWGYVEGETWAEDTELINKDGSERSAMTWLRSYLAELPDIGYPFDGIDEIVDTVENILNNGEFDTGSFPWQIDNYETGSGSISIVSDANMSGDYALQICTSAPGTERFHVQVSQNARFTSGKSYEISFMAKADEPLTIAVSMQKAGDPYTQYMEEEVNLTTEDQYFSFPFDPVVSGTDNKLKFFLGLNTSCIYLDRVIFREIEETGIQQAENIQSMSVYPNPVKSGLVTIENSSGEVITSVELLDLKGAMVKTVRPGQSKSEVEVSSLLKGMYFVRIHTENAVVSKKIVIL
ncbi:endo-1,4-beta-xylanase [Bacteroidota bacterium]